MSTGNSPSTRAADFWWGALIALLFRYLEDKDAIFGDPLTEGGSRTEVIESLEFHEDIEPGPSGSSDVFALFSVDESEVMRNE